ncbi:6-phosphogluconolactonase [Pseudoalteromonas aurantia]|uniref:6-phosphogluconolactonase n=1 Tax=Pseudoalteromonas aurantia TaxID=43654 RepID=A0A5S3VB49_9GAMM|nr:6-phosphogluconolactonase [Pseudoalteromonas aurantia]TMO68651.1 6-phosphogluconolactonase [Pseudoalteromonas aurantia]TMO74988.1 6-phosphogluconolactonase [Pseudoalteromonas aurantia]
MANIVERIFESKAQMTEALASLLEVGIANGIKQDGKALVMVSGGSSPAPAYKYLSDLPLEWDKVSIAMVDERWVEPVHEKSNEAFINETLLQNKAADAEFIVMKNSASSALAGQVECEHAYQALKIPDVTILGMGPDGHTASLFPHAEGLESGLQTSDIVCAINAVESAVTGSITERMSLTLNGIARSKEVVLLISGDEKRAMYEQAKSAGSELDIPLRAVINHPQITLSVFWCP